MQIKEGGDSAEGFVEQSVETPQAPVLPCSPNGTQSSLRPSPAVGLLIAANLSDYSQVTDRNHNHVSAMEQNH